MTSSSENKMCIVLLYFYFCIPSLIFAHKRIINGKIDSPGVLKRFKHIEYNQFTFIHRTLEIYIDDL